MNDENTVTWIYSINTIKIMARMHVYNFYINNPIRVMGEQWAIGK